MLTAEENERLTRVGAGTPMGTMMRWYWHPIAASAELLKDPVKKVRLLGEDLVLFKDRQGKLGLIGDRCAHRATGLQYGILDEDGLRCPYHGWKYDASGQCIDQPLEPPGSTFKDRIQIKGYPVEELGGLIFGYLGPEPAPLLPRWDFLVRDDAFRQIFVTVVPCNWLQCQDNGGDPQHGRYTHGHFYRYLLDRMKASGKQVSKGLYGVADSFADNTFAELRAETFEYGQRKWAKREGADEWREHRLVVFPNISTHGGRVGFRQEAQIRIPMDDTHTWHVNYQCYIPGPGVEIPKQDVIPVADVPFADENGDPRFDYIVAQDFMTWWSQGEITDRTQEHLGYTDIPLIHFRELLEEQLDVVEDGGQPMNVFYDPAKNQRLDLPIELTESRRPSPPGWWLILEEHGESPLAADVDQHSPAAEQLLDLWRREMVAQGRR